MSKEKRYSRDLLLVAFLILLVPVFFHKVLFTGKPLFGSDFVLQFNPWKHFMYESLRTHGQLPFWNPHVLSGTPFIANIQAAMFYPLGFLFYLMPPNQAFGYTIMVHFAFGAVFMYVFARSIPVDRAGAFVAAAIFTFNGFFVSHLYAGHLTFVQNYIWMPLIFLCLNKFCQSVDVRFAALGGLCLGVQILGGFPQIAFYTILAIVLFVAWHAAPVLKNGHWKRLFQLSSGTALLILAGFCLAAVQLLPTYEFTQLSGRSGGVSYAFATSDSFDPVNFVTLLMPDFFGNVTNRTYWKSKEIWQFWELCAYAGIAPLLLVGLIRKASPGRRVWTFFGFLLLAALFLALGRYNPIYRFVYYLPGFSHFRIPAQILYLYIFALAVLAGVGFNSASRLRHYPGLYKVMAGALFLLFAGLICLFFLFPARFFEHLFSMVQPAGLTPHLFEELHDGLRLSILTAAGFFVLLILLIHWRHENRIGSTTFTAVLFLVAMVDLWSFTNPMIQTANLKVSPEKKNTIETLANEQELFRIVTAGDFLKPNEAMLHGYHNIEGYDPLILGSYLDYINKSQNTPHFSEAIHIYYVTQLDNNLIRMLNLKYAVEPDGRILESNDVMERAFLVPRATSLPLEGALDYMMSERFDPRQEVILSPENQPLIAGPEKPGDFMGSCYISHYSPDTIRIRTSAGDAGYLVLSEVFYPGWQATVDGKEAPVLRGNYVLRVIPLEKGDHEVELRFVSWPFRYGLMVSLLTLAGCLGLILWKTKRKGTAESCRDSQNSVS